MRSLCVLFLTFVLVATADQDSALQEFIIGNHLFTGSIYRELSKIKDGNFIVSPFSLETVLALAQSGANGDTASEIRTGLRLPNTTEKISSVYQEILPTFKGNDHYALRTANKLYVEDNYELDNDFLKIARDVYQGDAENVEFTDTRTTADTINKWVAEQTENIIQEIVNPTSLDPTDKLFLVNTLYFKGKWLNQFDPTLTYKRAFYINAENTVNVDSMFGTSLYGFYDSKELDARYLELPYQGADISMVIILPNQREGLKALENNIEQLFIPPEFTHKLVNVVLPKFTVDTEIDFIPILSTLGVRRAFSTAADFSRMTGRRNDIYIDKIVQKVFINVTEDGTEAAAATGVGVHPSITGEVDFVVDHSFLYYIQFEGIILFGGRVAIPSDQ